MAFCCVLFAPRYIFKDYDNGEGGRVAVNHLYSCCMKTIHCCAGWSLTTSAQFSLCLSVRKLNLQTK